MRRVEATRSLAVKDMCRRRGFSEASCYLWKAKFGGMSVPEAKRLKELEMENARLKKISLLMCDSNSVSAEALRR